MFHAAHEIGPQHTEGAIPESRENRPAYVSEIGRGDRDIKRLRLPTAARLEHRDVMFTLIRLGGSPAGAGKLIVDRLREGVQGLVRAAYASRAQGSPRDGLPCGDQPRGEQAVRAGTCLAVRGACGLSRPASP